MAEAKDKKTKGTSQDIFDNFLFLEATDPNSAIELSELSLDPKIYSKKLQNLILEEVIIQVKGEEPEKFFVNIQRFDEWQTTQKKKFFLTLVSIIIPAALIILLALTWLIDIPV